MFKKFYLKLLMSLMLTALTVPQTWAETAEVGGTSTNNQVPLNCQYGDYGYHSQMVYSQAMLEEAGLPAGAKITAITFYTSSGYALSNPNGSANNPLTIKLGQPEGTTLPSFVTDNLTTVSTTGNIWSGETSVTLEFDSDKAYTYDGGNLLIDLSWAYASGGYYKSIYWLVSSATGASRYANNNSSGVEQSSTSSNYLPKITFTYESGEAQDYAAKVSPSSLDFGSLLVDATDTKSVTIQNKGALELPYTITGLNAPFSTTSTSGSIAAGSDVSVPVTFTPTAAGSFEGDMLISFPGSGLNDVTVHVTGSASDAICNGTDENTYLPIYGYCYDYTQKNQMIYPASLLTKYVGKNITALKFYTKDGVKYSDGSYNVSLGTTTQSEFASSSPSPASATLTVVKSGLTATDGVNGNELSITFDNPFLYEGGNLVVDFEVVTKGTCDPYSSRTNFIGENQSSNTAYYSYVTYGTNRVANPVKFLPKMDVTVGETPATPVITVDPATVEAFSTEVGTPVTATVNVTGENLTGDITANVSGDDAFTAALENGVLTITYNPTAAGNHTATVTLSSEGAQDVTIALTGTATAPAVDYAVTMSDNTGAHNYGNVLVNSSNVWTLTITNNGTQTVTPTLTGLEAPFSTTYTATALAAGESATISINYAPTELGEHSNTITISFPEAGDAIAAYTCELTGKAVEESYDPSDENEVVKLVTVDQRSIYEPAFIDNANGNTTPQQLNCYDMRFKMAQPDDPSKRIKAGDLRPGNNLFEFYAIDDFGTEFRFATINLFAEGQPSSNPSVNAMDAPIKVTPSVEYYTEDGMPVHPDHTHYTTLNYTEKTYNDINELVDLEGVIDYVNDTWSANTATNAHPDHYKFQIRGVGQYGDMVTSLTAEYVESHMTGYGNQLVMPEGWERGSFAGPNNEASDDVHTFYYYDLYIKKSFFDERGITGPVTVVVNTTLSGSGFNADNYKAMSVNGVEQIIAKEEFKDYSWTVPLLDEIPSSSIVEQVPMGVVIRLVSTGADFNRTTGIYIYGGGTGVSNVDTVNIYKSSMNVKAYTQKQVDDDTDRSLVAMNAGAKSDVNVLAYGDPAVTGYVLNKNTSASTTGMTEVASANHEIGDDVHRYVVNSTGTYNGSYNFIRDESLGNIDGMWLPMYPASENEYYLPVTWANGVGDDGVVRSENNTYGSAMQQVEKNGSVAFTSRNCERSQYTWVVDGETYSYYSPEVVLNGELPAAGYELYKYRLWVDYDDNAPAWDFEIDTEGKTHLTNKMDRPLDEGTTPELGGEFPESGKQNWIFVAPADLNEVKLVARFYYKKTSTGKARPTDKDRLYYVVENQVTAPVGVVTGVDNVSSKAVANVKYYNMMGVESNVPFQGANIEVITFTDGSRTTRKIMK
ncbi:MAG: choice-of-anchor D domain-containing protein [Muribaculaceae bacterium]|nr:choice-of-anchor D domain-containing protein [Muribaculaceae bacterium]